MAVLAADVVTPMKEAGLKSYPCEVDTLYKGGFGVITPAGYLQAAPAIATGQGMRFAGVIAEQVVCAVQGASFCRVWTEGVFKFCATSITQAMVGEMMYLVDDQTFDDEPGVEQIPVGILVEYVSATVGWIDISRATGATQTRRPVVSKAASYTVLTEESGAVFLGTLDGMTFSLPATQKGLVYTFVNTGADGALLINIDPAAADLIVGNDLIGSDGGILSNTKNTAKRADCVTIVGDGDIGWYIVASIGVWAIA